MTDILYFDGKCPLCSHEIGWLKRLQNGQLEFIDIHQINESELPFSKEILLQELHINAAGCWLKGADASVRAWSHTSVGWVLKPLRWPFIKTLVDSVYTWWAKRRFAKLYSCNSCLERP